MQRGFVHVTRWYTAQRRGRVRIGILNNLLRQDKDGRFQRVRVREGTFEAASNRAGCAFSLGYSGSHRARLRKQNVCVKGKRKIECMQKKKRKLKEKSEYMRFEKSRERIQCEEGKKRKWV